MNEKCPYCDFILPSDLDPRDRGQTEVSHMSENHQDVIDQRLMAAGFVWQNGKWVDTMVGQNSWD